MEVTCTTSAMYFISDVTVSIYGHSRRQSKRDLPDLGPFRHGLMSVKQLKAKERFPRIYYVFISLSNSYIIQTLCKKTRKKRENEANTPLLTTESLRGY